MREWLAGQGIAHLRMTAVPMGVDAALFRRSAIVPSPDTRLDGRRVVLYLGRVAQSRRSDFLLDVAERLRVHLPESLLVIVGDAPSPDEMAWMRQAIAARGLGEHVLLTGWLPQQAALGYAVRAEVGLSPIPRGTLFDVSSPTKLVEYLALGIPAVANDIPDQALVIEQSGAGLCVPMHADAFAAATLRLLADPDLAAACAGRILGLDRAACRTRLDDQRVGRLCPVRLRVQRQRAQRCQGEGLEQALSVEFHE
jgi:glycosyltransferase involved in cell wall biosynthesis